MGARSCGPLRARVPRFFLRVPRSSSTFFSRSHVFSRSYMLLYQRVYICEGGGGFDSSRALCVYRRIRWAGSTRHLVITPLITRARCTIILAGSRFGVKLISRPQSPPFTSPLSTHHNCVISSQEREFSVPILSRSCIKFAFLRALVPKIPGTWERGNAKPGTRSQERVARNACPYLKTIARKKY